MDYPAISLQFLVTCTATTYAIAAAPSIPNRSALSFFATGFRLESHSPYSAPIFIQSINVIVEICYLFCFSQAAGLWEPFAYRWPPQYYEVY